MVSLECATTLTGQNVLEAKDTIHPLAQSTVTGSMASLDMKHLALDTGPVGTAQPQNNFVLEVFFTMKKHTPVIGLRMLVAVRNILSARMTPTVMCH